MAVVGIVLAGLSGRTGLNDAGIVQVLYVALLPAAMYGILMIAKFWVESLPSQVCSTFLSLAKNSHFSVHFRFSSRLGSNGTACCALYRIYLSSTLSPYLPIM